MVLALNLLLFVGGLITFREDFKRVGLTLISLGGLGILLWLLFFVRSIRKENESLKAALRAATQDGGSHLSRVYQRLEAAMNTWEEGHPAGPEAWRTEVTNLYQEAEQIIETQYSAEEAARFCAVKPQDAIDYSDISGELDDLMKREFLLDAKLKFIYELLHSGGSSGH